MSETKPDLPALRDVLARLERATGPDRELDAAIWEAMGRVSTIPAYRLSVPTVHHPEMVDRFSTAGRWIGFYTASIDAADALRERMRPGKWFACGIDSNGKAWCEVEIRCAIVAVNAPTIALAILIALFRALVAQQENAQ